VGPTVNPQVPGSSPGRGARQIQKRATWVPVFICAVPNGSKHSMNLVMIGRFKETRDAENAGQLIEKIAEQVRAEPDHYERDSDSHPEDRRFGMMNTPLGFE
jgi:Family of unknown function (DUF6375)